MEINFELGSVKGLVESSTTCEVAFMQLSDESRNFEFLKITDSIGIFSPNQLMVLFELSKLLGLSFGVVTNKQGFAFLCERRYYRDLLDYFSNSL